MLVLDSDSLTVIHLTTLWTRLATSGTNCDGVTNSKAATVGWPYFIIHELASLYLDLLDPSLDRDLGGQVLISCYRRFSLENRSHGEERRWSVVWRGGERGGGGPILNKQSDFNLPDGSCGHKGIRSSDKYILHLKNISFCFFHSHFTHVVHVKIQPRYWFRLLSGNQVIAKREIDSYQFCFISYKWS